MEKGLQEKSIILLYSILKSNNNKGINYYKKN